jgi:flagellin
VQAGNDTNTYNDRQSIQDEIDALVKEVDRISTDTEYNSKTLLDGSCNTRVYSQEVERLDVSENVLPKTYQFDVTQAAEQATCTIEVPKTDDLDGTIKINGVSLEYTEDMKVDGSDDNNFFRELSKTAEQAGCTVERVYDDATGDLKEYRITSRDYGSDETIALDISGSLGKELVSDTNVARKLAVDASSAYSKEPDSSGEAEIIFSINGATKGTITINGVDLEITAATDLTKGLEEAANKAGCTMEYDAASDSYTLRSSDDILLEFSNDIADDVTVVEEEHNSISYGFDSFGKDAKLAWDELADQNDPDSGAVKITGGFSSTAAYSADGKRITITDASGFSIDFMLKDSVNKNPDPNNQNADPNTVKIEVTDIGAMTIQIGANQYQEMDVCIPEISSESLYLDTVDVTIPNGPDKALITLDEAINKLGNVRSGIGAYTNRLEYATSSLSETQLDLTTAFSNLVDTDMAAEMTEYTQQNVLEQAAISVLAQANDLPQQVLSLLQ